METLNDYNKSLIRREKSFMKRQGNIDFQIQQLENKKSKMKWPNLIKVFEPLCIEIQAKLNADGFVLYGPFGLCNEKTIYWLKDSEKDITVDGNVLGSLCFISDSDGVKIRNTNIDNKNCLPGSISYANGMYHPSIEIDNTMDIEWLLDFVKRM